MEIKLTPKPVDWFRKNAYQDNIGDWWISEDEWNYFDDGGYSRPTMFVTNDEVNDGVFIDGSMGDKIEMYEWCIEETPETHPQYWL
jgi:hypothetical protein